ncbi:phage baseplate assembly protein V [Flavobacterium sp. MC2016-06]|uniref:type VI secretion system Vgr family protein n=1 Tax=Flavobacterium sp. MC2016-06 TaxID=2676308 RepID=UPI0012BAFAD0|nr:phage baseplate assembly protein V [Flavobacterium sp. MC2016-06]MBU3858764.1 type IV secretion protein Rhs [Flavobacterium sp. MC2016-06]
MAHFADQVHISIDGFTLNVIHSDLKISQKMADHHYFSFAWYYAPEVVINPVDQAKALRSYIGSEVIFTFLVNGIRLMSKGIINEFVSQDRNGSPDGIYVHGISHTIALDDRPISRTFLELALQDIVPRILFEGPDEFYQKESISPTYRKEFKYLAQYNESSFNFLKRIAARYGQWFYFDGMRMQFGQLKTSKVKLINNLSLEDFKIQINLTAHKTSFGAYDPDNAVNIKSSAAKTTDGSRDSFSNIVGYTQASVAQPHLNDALHTSNAQNKEEIDQMVKLQTAGLDANSVFYSGTSSFPIGVGQIFTIVNGTVEHELLAIEVTHLSKLRGNYCCEFKAIPADVTAPHYTNVTAFAKAETQPAKITDNNDPEGMGRVRVKFNWGASSSTSDWIRMIQPHSGGDKGFYFIPEIDEEVLVGFEGANIQRPFVMGTQYNGKAKSGYSTPNNDLKVMRTRSGILIIYNDADGSLLIEDPSGNKYFMDGKGNISLDAPKNMSFTAGENITMNAGQNMTTTVGMHKTDTIGGNHEEDITGSKTSKIGLNFILTVIGSMFEWIQGNKEIESKDLKESAQEIFINSTEKSVNLRGAKDVNSHSGENSRNY